MKMTKKILMGAVAAAALVMFAGCELGSLSKLTHTTRSTSNNIKCTYDDTEFADGNGHWYFKGSNPSSTEQERVIDLLTTKHSDLAALITIKNVTPGADNSKPVSRGVSGIVFDLVKTKAVGKEGEEGYVPEKFSFMLASVIENNNDTTGKPGYYVSYFANVTVDDLAKKNFGANNGTKDITYESVEAAEAANVTTPYEVVFKTITSFTGSNLIDTESNSFSYLIDVDEKEDGSYDVKFGPTSNIDLEKLTLKDDPKWTTVNVPAAKIGKTEAAQARVGAYACVYAVTGATTENPTYLDSEVKLFKVTNDAVVVE